MKSLRSLLLYGLLIGSLGLLYYTNAQTPCDEIVSYDIGTFDERFGIKKEAFVEILARAETPWETTAGKDLFVYTPGADFKVHLIWSQEQDRLYQGRDISNDLDNQEKGIGSLQSRYDSAVSAYEKSLKDYETKLKKYEKDVDYWNAQGGAPSEKYNQLQQESVRLQSKAKDVEKLRVEVNKLADENNTEVQKYNLGVQEYNQLFKNPKEFDAGNTDGQEINVYSYDGNEELHALLVHEFGHVLGIDHVENEESVMFYLLNEKNKKGILSTEDIESFSQSCKY